jgi:membrane fusion protein (multidrug efflux system)
LRQAAVGWKQVSVFAVFVAAAVGLWLERDRLGDLWALASVTEPAPGAKPKRPGAAGVPVIVATVGEAENDVAIEAIGTARAKRSVTLFPAAAGEVVELGVEAGQQVEKNQPILQLDPRDQELAAKVAQTKLQEAKRLRTRSEKLRKSRVNATANVEDAKTVEERAQLELEQALVDLADRIVKAPFAGIVGIPKVEIGDRITPSTEVITIDDRSTLLVEFEVPERYLSQLRSGLELSAVTPTFPNRRIAGAIERIDSRVDPTSRTVKVRAAFRNDDDALRPGVSFFVDLRLPGPRLPTVPELALQWNNGESFVWRVVDGAAEKVPLRSEKRLNDIILVSGDIRPGDLVVIEGVQRLRPGRAVRFSTPVPAPESASEAAPNAAQGS